MLSKIVEEVEKACYYFGLVFILRKLNESKLRILMYHDVTNSPEIYPSALNVSIPTFEKQMKYLSKNYNILSISQLVLNIKLNRPFPKNSVVLTFDDGLKSNIEVVAPILDKFGFKATFYVVGQCVNGNILWLHRWYTLEKIVGKEKMLKSLSIHVKKEVRSIRHGVQLLKYEFGPKEREDILKLIESEFSIKWTPEKNPYMDKEDILKLIKLGHEIGYHTQTHSPVVSLDKTNLNLELVISKERLEKKVGKIEHFSYPFGEETSLGEADDIVVKEYDCAVTTVEGLVSSKSNLYKLKRLSVVEGSISSFAASVEGIRGIAVNIYQKISRKFV